jgi:hypothetical protein
MGKVQKPSNSECYIPSPEPLDSRMIKSKSMRWAGHVAQIGENTYKILWESQKEITTRKTKT